MSKLSLTRLFSIPDVIVTRAKVLESNGTTNNAVVTIAFIQ